MVVPRKKTAARLHGTSGRVSFEAPVVGMETVSVLVAVTPLATCTCAGLREQLGTAFAVPEPWNWTMQLSAAIPEKPFCPLNWMTPVADPPADERLRVGVPGANESALAPVPLSGTVCGEPGALDVMVSVPVLVPVAVGAKVTVTVQSSFSSTPPLQVFVWLKSPEAVIEEIDKASFPTFITCNSCCSLELTLTEPKSMFALDKVTAGP
jgi:hypothetical protein